MAVTVAIPAIERADLVEGVLGNLDSMLELDSSEIILIDNGPMETHTDTVHAIEQSESSRSIVYREPGRNLSIFESIQLASKIAKNDILAFLHTDTRIETKGFDRFLVEEFSKDGRLGLAGLVGAEGITSLGDWEGRVYSRLTHKKEIWALGPVVVGEPTPDEGVAVACLDGCGMFFRRDLIPQLLDMSYPGLHHWYDKEVSCAWLAAGWRVKALPIVATHGGEPGASLKLSSYWHDAEVLAEKLGRTKEAAGYPNPDHFMYAINRDTWREKWGPRMPVQVHPNYVVEWGGR